MRIGLQRALALQLFIALLLLWQFVFAAGDERFESQTIPLNIANLGIFSAEMNGVAGRELVVFVADDTGARKMRIYQKGPGRRFAEQSAAEISVSPDVFATQVVDFDNDGRDEIMLLSFESVSLIEYENGAYLSQPRQIAIFDRLFSVPASDEIARLDFVFDLNDDGVYELLLPSWRGVELYEKKNNSYTLGHEFVVRQHSDIRRNSDFLAPNAAGVFGFRFPRVVVHDLNTDRVKDVFIETGAGLFVFYQTGQFKFADQPGKEIDVRPSYREGLFFASSDFGDINGDGLVDYCRVFTQGEGYDAKSLVEVFLGNIHEGYPSRPSKRIVLDEFVVGVKLKDLDNDGSASLIVATQQLSTISMMKSLMVKRIPVELKVFKAVGGQISDVPVAVKKTSCAVQLLQHSFPARFIGCLDGDVNSDRRNELAIIDHDNELQVYQGDQETVFGDKPYYSMSAENFVSVDACDFDLDRKSDLILSGTDEDAHPVLLILWAR
jgi:hypothetical protein